MHKHHTLRAGVLQADETHLAEAGATNEGTARQFRAKMEALLSGQDEENQTATRQVTTLIQE